MHHGAVSDDAHVRALSRDPRFAERHGIVGTGVSRAVVRLAVKMLVLEEHYWVVRAYRRPQQAAKIERRRRHHHSQPRNVGENYFAALAVINPATGQITADGHADHRRAFEMSSGPPSQVRQLVAELHHGRPDVIEKLYLRHRLETPHRHPQRPSYDSRFGDR